MHVNDAPKLVLRNLDPEVISPEDQEKLKCIGYICNVACCIFCTPCFIYAMTCGRQSMN